VRAGGWEEGEEARHRSTELTKGCMGACCERATRAVRLERPPIHCRPSGFMDTKATARHADRRWEKTNVDRNKWFVVESKPQTSDC
jgi:hypothetical protein